MRSAWLFLLLLPGLARGDGSDSVPLRSLKSYAECIAKKVCQLRPTGINKDLLLGLSKNDCTEFKSDEAAVELFSGAENVGSVHVFTKDANFYAANDCANVEASSCTVSPTAKNLKCLQNISSRYQESKFPLCEIVHKNPVGELYLEMERFAKNVDGKCVHVCDIKNPGQNQIAVSIITKRENFRAGPTYGQLGISQPRSVENIPFDYVCVTCGDPQFFKNTENKTRIHNECFSDANCQSNEKMETRMIAYCNGSVKAFKEMKSCFKICKDDQIRNEYGFCVDANPCRKVADHKKLFKKWLEAAQDTKLAFGRCSDSEIRASLNKFATKKIHLFDEAFTGCQRAHSVVDKNENICAGNRGTYDPNGWIANYDGSPLTFLNHLADEGFRDRCQINSELLQKIAHDPFIEWAARTPWIEEESFQGPCGERGSCTETELARIRGGK
jgi:hypothetical protein